MNFNFKEYLQQQQPVLRQNPENDVQYFSIKSGEEAIVRFDYDTADDLDCFHTHRIEINGKFRSISCLREPTDSLDKCPLCAHGTQITDKIFVKLLHYKVDPTNGTVTVIPCVWERGMNVARTLASYMLEYGSLKDLVFKIKRTGSGLDTKYDIMYVDQAKYNENVFNKDKLAILDTIKLTGRFIMDKTADEIEQFIQTGEFPTKQREQHTESDPLPKSFAQPGVVERSIPATSYSTTTTANNSQTFTPKTETEQKFEYYNYY